MEENAKVKSNIERSWTEVTKQFRNLKGQRFLSTRGTCDFCHSDWGPEAYDRSSRSDVRHMCMGGNFCTSKKFIQHGIM